MFHIVLHTVRLYCYTFVMLYTNLYCSRLLTIVTLVLVDIGSAILVSKHLPSTFHLSIDMGDIITTPSNLQSLNVPVVQTLSHLLHVTVCSYSYIPYG